MKLNTTCLAINAGIIVLSPFLSIASQYHQPTLLVNGSFTPSEQQIATTREIFTHQKPTLFVDFHGVCARKSYKKAFSKLSESVPTVREKCILAASVIALLCDPRAYSGTWKMLHMPEGKNKIVESYFNYFKSLGYETLYKTVIAFSNNMYVEDPQTIALLQTLKNAGYPLILFSNIGATILNDVKQRNCFPNALPIFNNKNVINNEAPENGTYTIFKPNPIAYQTALDTTNASAEKAIMIDDKPKNLPSTWAAGIVFHNAQQCATDLAKIGISTTNEKNDLDNVVPHAATHDHYHQ